MTSFFSFQAVLAGVAGFSGLAAALQSTGACFLPSDLEDTQTLILGLEDMGVLNGETASLHRQALEKIILGSYDADNPRVAISNLMGSVQSGAKRKGADYPEVVARTTAMIASRKFGAVPPQPFSNASPETHKKFEDLMRGLKRLAESIDYTRASMARLFHDQTPIAKAVWQELQEDLRGESWEMVRVEETLVRFAKAHPQLFKPEHISILEERSANSMYCAEILRILRDRRPDLFPRKA